MGERVRWHGIRLIMVLALVVGVFGTVSPALGVGGSISGTVTGGGVPAPSCAVEAYDAVTGELVAQANTTAAGVYSITGLPAGDYVIRFNPFWTPGDFIIEYYDDAKSEDDATPVHVNAGADTPGINAVLSEGGAIAGHVTADGAPLEGVWVYASDPDTGVRLSAAQTNSTGDYVIPDLPVDDYVIEFNTEVYVAFGAQYMSEYYNNTPLVELAAPVHVSAGVTTSGINAVIDRGGVLRGTVMCGGLPLKDVDVYIYDAVSGYEAGRTTTDSYGIYAINLKPGAYLVEFDPTDINGTLGTDFYGEFYWDSANEANAETVDVVADQQTMYIDASLESASYISGTVTGDGAALPGIDIRVYATDNTEAGYAWTDEDGGFVVYGLTEGDYKIHFDPTWFNEEYEVNAQYEFYRDTQDYSQVTLVHVTRGQGTSGIDAVLEGLDWGVPIYRFYNVKNGTHFYTDSRSERDMVMAQYATIYLFEGAAYYANPFTNTQSLYRFYNRVNGSHFYTASVDERNTVMASLSHIFTYDGPTYAVNPSETPGSIAVYRFYNRVNGSHFYTASADERETVKATLSHIYTYEGPAFFVGQ